MEVHFMFHQKVKQILNNSISYVANNLESYVKIPGKDYSRVKKIPAEAILSFFISQGASSSKCEWLDFHKLSADAPSLSAMNQRRSQLKPEAFQKVFQTFTSNMQTLLSSSDTASCHYNQSNYQYIAADGSTITFFSFPKFASDDYYVSEGHSARGFYSIHINAFYNLKQKVYTDALLQPVHKKDEFRAFCDMVDEHEVPFGEKHIFIGDRGYCSYNNMAHVIEKKQFFLFRTKDKDRKGLIGNFDFPETEEFDIDINVSLVRSHRKSIKIKEGNYKRFIDSSASFDYVEYGSDAVYDMEFRVVRFAITENTYECIVTNLPRDSFPPDKIKESYNSRWGIETSFRKLKYTIGLSSYHAYKPEYIEQEIWAKLTAYNATEFITNHAVIEKRECQYTYAINFTIAAHLCRIYLSWHTKIDSIDIMALITKELVAIRGDRQFARLKTAHFRKPKYLIYRAA